MSVAVRALLQPEPHAVASLYRAHFDFVWQVLRKLGVEASSVEDATQDVFVVAHRRWADFRGESAPRTWLYSVARRVASRHRRTDARRRRRRAALVHAPPRDALGPDGAVARKQAWNQLLAFLETLDTGQREAFVLGEVEGLSRSRLGVALGVSPNTAYSRLRAARRQFEVAFPDPESRRCLAEASAPPSAKDRRRGWLLLTGGVSWGPLASVVAVAAFAAVGVGTFAPEPSRVLPAVASVHIEPDSVSPTPPVPSRDAAEPAAEVVVAVPRVHPASPSRTSPPRRRARRDPPRRAPAREAPRAAALSPAMQALVDARGALRAQRPGDALKMLETCRRLDTTGAFITERAVTRVWALCALGRDADAEREFAGLQRGKGTAAYADVLGRSCVGPLISSARAGDEGR